MFGSLTALCGSDFPRAKDIRKNVAWNARAEGEAAVVATRAKGSFGILRAIVKSLAYGGWGGGGGVAFGL
jgi:hypothetical protein